MCPVLRLASIVQRIRRSSFCLVNSSYTTCTLLGGTATFGYGACDIGTKSLPSGAAMALFLMDHSVTKIMLLGRWSSNAFLNYIRPQVLEWTNQLSRDMIHHNSFFDVTEPRRDPPDAPRTRRRRSTATRPAHASMHLHHH